MDWLRDLGVISIAEQLPRAAWSIGTRAATTSITWHYNGPEVPPDRQAGAGLLAQLRADAAYQMRPGWGGTVDGADGLMYHLVVAADGAIYQTRALDAVLWHCAHQDGNSRGLALHLPLGGTQQPAPAQLRALILLTTALRAAFGIVMNRTLGHQEWKHATACPGVPLMRALIDYRGGIYAPITTPTPLPPGVSPWQISPSLSLPARVRQAPGIHQRDGSEVPIVTRLKPGTIVYVDRTVVGEAVDGNAAWLHMAEVPHEQAAAGYLSATLGRWVS